MGDGGIDDANPAMRNYQEGDVVYRKLPLIQIQDISWHFVKQLRCESKTPATLPQTGSAADKSGTGFSEAYPQAQLRHEKLAI